MGEVVVVDFREEDIVRISSREVAVMMDVTHSNLVRKIDGINEDFREINYDFSELWIDGAYKTEGNNKTYKEYLVSKQGCEFLSHKSTGTKGNIFTLKYMQRFKEMEEQLKSQVPQISEKEQMLLKLFSKDPVEVAQAHNRIVEIEVEEATVPLIAEIEEQKPKVEYHDEVLQSDKLITTTDVAKDLGMSATALNNLLHENKVIYPKMKKKFDKKKEEWKEIVSHWIPYSNYQFLIPDYADYKISQHDQQLRWKESGRQWIIEFIRNI